MPLTSLTDAWDALDDVRGGLTSGRWLTRRVAAFRWHTELTKGASWNPHSNLLLASRFGPQDLRSEVLGRWGDAAAERGFEAHSDPDAAQEITRTRRRALGYLAKGPVALHGDSRTAGRILLDAAMHHDAEAAADWLEIENASAGRRWQGTGGEFRARRTVIVQDPEHDDLMALLEVEITVDRRRAPTPSSGSQVPAEHRQQSVLAERAEAARERREQHERDQLIAEAFAAARAREEAEHDDRLDRFARHRDDIRTTDDASLFALLET